MLIDEVRSEREMLTMSDSSEIGETRLPYSVW